MIGNLESFISPVSGKILIPQNMVLIGDEQGHSTPVEVLPISFLPSLPKMYTFEGAGEDVSVVASPSIIDLKLELRSVKNSYDRFKESEFFLADQCLFVGNSFGLAEQKKQIGVGNLPPLDWARFPLPASLVPQALSQAKEVPIPNLSFDPSNKLSYAMSIPFLPQSFIASATFIDSLDPFKLVSPSQFKWQTIASSNLALTQVKVDTTEAKIDKGTYIVKSRDIDFDWQHPYFHLDTLVKKSTRNILRRIPLVRRVGSNRFVKGVFDKASKGVEGALGLYGIRNDYSFGSHVQALDELPTKTGRIIVLDENDDLALMPPSFLEDCCDCDKKNPKEIPVGVPVKPPVKIPDPVRVPVEWKGHFNDKKENSHEREMVLGGLTGVAVAATTVEFAKDGAMLGAVGGPLGIVAGGAVGAALGFLIGKLFD